MQNPNENPFNKLHVRAIYDILNGTTEFGILKINGHETSVQLSMPYLTGKMICDISGQFGLPQLYSQVSRWEYFRNIISFCIQNDTIVNLLLFLFRKDNFFEKLRDLPNEEINIAYTIIVNNILKEINKILFFSNNKMIITNSNIFIKNISHCNIVIDAPQIKIVDSKYIKTLQERAELDIAHKQYDRALTTARTLLEEVFCHILDKNGFSQKNKGKILDLYKQVTSLYSMQPENHVNTSVKMLLSGLKTVIQAIGEMRNFEGDAHGHGALRLGIEERHARLFVNSAVVIAEFIFAVSEHASLPNSIAM